MQSRRWREEIRWRKWRTQERKKETARWREHSERKGERSKWFPELLGEKSVKWDCGKLEFFGSRDLFLGLFHPVVVVCVWVCFD